MLMSEKYKILLVDDEAEVRQSIIKKIDWEKAGFRVVGDAENGIDALEKAEALEPDLILTDIRMPYMDGLELAENITKVLPSVKIVIFSGYDDFEYAKQAIKLNIIEYILKPIDAVELTGILEKIKAKLDEEITVIKDMSNLKENFEKNLPILRETFLGNLVKGKVEKDKIKEFMNDYNIDIINGKFWTAIKVNMTVSSSENIPVSIMQSMSVKKLLDSRLKDIGIWECFHRPSGICGIWAMQDRQSFLLLTNMLNDICRESLKLLDIHLKIGIGRIVSSIDEISESYSDAREAVSYKNFIGDVVYIDEVELTNRDFLKFDENAENDLIYAIKFGEEENILSSIENIISHIKGREYSPMDIQTYVISIINALIKIVQANDFDNEIIFGEYEDFGGVMVGIKTAEDLEKWLSRVSFSISALLYKQRQGTTKSLIAKAKKYIEENYQNSSLSLEMICDYLHVSTAYFSTLFKKEMGESYISYLTGMRLEKAVELLKTTDDKTYIIASNVGYDEPNYFSYVFKKKYGVSPNKFRGK